MKTTLEMPAALLRRVKARAATEGRSMKSLIVDALENTLRGQSGQATPQGWRTVFGRASASAVAEVDRRMADLERIDPKDWE